MIKCLSFLELQQAITSECLITTGSHCDRLFAHSPSAIKFHKSNNCETRNIGIPRRHENIYKKKVNSA